MLSASTSGRWGPSPIHMSGFLEDILFPGFKEAATPHVTPGPIAGPFVRVYCTWFGDQCWDAAIYKLATREEPRLTSRISAVEHVAIFSPIRSDQALFVSAAPAVEALGPLGRGLFGSVGRLRFVIHEPKRRRLKNQGVTPLHEHISKGTRPVLISWCLTKSESC